jgi:hypothetical protein
MHERRTSPRQWVAFVIFVLAITALIGVGVWLGFSSVFKSCCTTA